MTQPKCVRMQPRSYPWIGCACLLVALLALSSRNAKAEEPPRKLTPEQQKEVNRLEAEADEHIAADEFEKAVEGYEKLLAYRTEYQGKNHWEVKDARLKVERWQRLCRVARKDRSAFGQSFRIVSQGTGLFQRGQYRPAEAKFREALGICQKVLGEEHPDTAQHYNDVAVCLNSQGKSAEALPLYQKALGIRQKVLGDEHPDTAESYNNLGSWLYGQGKYAEALPLYQKALGIRQKVLGEKHPDTAKCYDRVAACLESQGKYAEALPLYQKALGIRQKVLGDEHPDTAESHHNLGSWLYGQGKYAEALPLYQKALGIRQKVLGEKHPDTAKCYGNVASCLHSQGKYAEALPLYQKALGIHQRVLGEEHPDTANCYNNVALCLQRQGKAAEALPLYQKALGICQRVLGEQHPDTATSYNNVALCLQRQGKAAEALPLYQKALGICQRVLGEEHPDTATSYNNLAACLLSQSKAAEALPLYQKALGIRQRVLGEQHPDTATSYNNVAACLLSQSKAAEALPLFQKALGIHQRVLGEEHPDTANCYNNVALCLQRQGKAAEALPLYQKALGIEQKMLGEEHPDTATSYNNLAACLHSQGKAAEALPQFQKALGIWQKVLGEEHPHTAMSYNNVASCLDGQGKAAEALPLFQKALGIWQKVLGDEHPHAAMSYGNVASCLLSQGKAAEALPQFQKALGILQKMLGEEHPHTAQSYNNLGSCLYRQGKHAEAAENWQKALLGFEFGRLEASSSGFDRSLFKAESVSPRAALACALVRLEQPLDAWEQAESDLARGLLDDLDVSQLRRSNQAKLQRLAILDQALTKLFAQEKLEPEQLTKRQQLNTKRSELLNELAQQAVARARQRVLPLNRIQEQIPKDAAVVFWLDVRQEHLGCVLRREGSPKWVRLPGSGKEGDWTDEDDSLPSRALSAVSESTSDPATGSKLLAALYAQRLAPLKPHLEGVRHLLVVPAGRMVAFPVEALTDEYSVSYIPSASIYARQAEKHRALQASSLLVLADPTFTRTKPKLPQPPSHGLFVKAVLPKSLATRIGLHTGDVLMEYNGKKLTKPDDLVATEGEERVPIKLWREGKTLAGRIPSGKLGVIVDPRPVATALAEWHDRQQLVLARGDDWTPLSGTRLEARTLASLIEQTKPLLGSEANEQSLHELASTGQLKQYRILHFATHGEAFTKHPHQTALILAQDKLPTPDEQAKRVLEGKPRLEGKLTVQTILDEWELDADLVVLSACESGLGKDAGGEGMLGFSQALLQKGARSVVLSRWKVDDAATSLLMARFYQNLLGKRDGLNTPLPRAEALREAKTWLRTLTRSKAEQRLAKLVDGVPRGERGRIGAKLPTRNASAPAKDECPFAHPYYWAAFVLIGDPK